MAQAQQAKEGMVSQAGLQGEGEVVEGIVSQAGLQGEGEVVEGMVSQAGLQGEGEDHEEVHPFISSCMPFFKKHRCVYVCVSISPGGCETSCSYMYMYLVQPQFRKSAAVCSPGCRCHGCGLISWNRVKIMKHYFAD